MALLYIPIHIMILKYTTLYCITLYYTLLCSISLNGTTYDITVYGSMLYHTTSYYIILHYIVLYSIISYAMILRNVTRQLPFILLYCLILYGTTIIYIKLGKSVLYYIILHYITRCDITSYDFILYSVTPRHAIIHYIFLYSNVWILPYVILSYIIAHHRIPCYIVQHVIIWYYAVLCIFTHVSMYIFMHVYRYTDGWLAMAPPRISSGPSARAAWPDFGWRCGWMSCSLPPIGPGTQRRTLP